MTTTRRRGAVTVTTALAAAVLPLLAAGTAHAEEPAHDTTSTTGHPSTQSPTQAADAGGATAENATESFSDAADGEARPYGTESPEGQARPEGVDGTDTEFPDADPRFLEGPLGGLLNGPLD